MIRETTLHATTVALNGGGLLICGPSGSGKSSLALELMAVGAVLVSDDRTRLECHEDRLWASPPLAIAGKIEARGVGLLCADHQGPVPVALMLDLGRSETMRLPPRHVHEILGIIVPVVLGPYRPQLYAALRQYMLGGRFD